MIPRPEYLRQAVLFDVRAYGRQSGCLLRDIVARLEGHGFRDTARPLRVFRSEVANALAHLRRLGRVERVQWGGWWRPKDSP